MIGNYIGGKTQFSSYYPDYSEKATAKKATGYRSEELLEIIKEL